MSSKIIVTFAGPDTKVISHEAFSIRHLRNYEQTPTGATVPSTKGGYTILSDKTGGLYVSKCHPRSDRFCKRLGLAYALDRFINKNYPQLAMVSMESLGSNRFEVLLDNVTPISPI